MLKSEEDKLQVWDKILASHISDISLLFKKESRNELLKLNNKTTNPIFKCGRTGEKIRKVVVPFAKLTI